MCPALDAVSSATVSAPSLPVGSHLKNGAEFEDLLGRLDTGETSLSAFGHMLHENLVKHDSPLGEHLNQLLNPQATLGPPST